MPTITKSEIEKCFLKLRNSAPGPDSIPPAFLKALRHCLALPIAALLQKCLATGQFPSNLKTAQIAPIPKLSGSCDPADYRPICVTSAISKIFEYWMLFQIKDCIIPSDHQSGFRARCGTGDALLTLQHYVATGLDSCPRAAHVLVSSLDIFRAFDQVNHNLLLSLLQDRSIPVPVLAVIASFFRDRRQFVKVGAAKSHEQVVTSGVCQGTVLGPFLFNVVVDRIFQTASLSPGSHFLMYADDLVYVKALPFAESLLEAQKDLDKLNRCYSDIGLIINAKKSQVLLVSASRRSADRPKICLRIAGGQLPCVSALRYLGVYLDESFSFSSHAHTSAGKAKKELGALYRRVGRWVPSLVFLKLYRQVILPQITYALSAAAPYHKRDWCQLEGIQKFALRLTANNYRKSYTELLNEYQIPRIVQLYFEQSAKLAYQYVYNIRHSPFAVFRNFIDFSNSHYNLRNRTVNTINPLAAWKFRRSRPLDICTHLPVYRLIKIWNLLPDDNVSYGLKQFSSKLSNSVNCFSNFCDEFMQFLVYDS